MSWWRKALPLLVVAALLAPASPTRAVMIERARADRLSFEPAKGEAIGVAFRIDEAARVYLELYDGRDVLIRRVGGEDVIPAGEHEIRWDGRDEAGRVVPAEAYSYVLRAVGGNGEEATYDLTDATGGREIKASNVEWDLQGGVVRYVLPALSRVNVRVGIKNGGPLLRTLIDWVPREAGIQEERWDGQDGSGVIDLAGHPELGVVVNAFALPDNTVLIGPRPQKSVVIEDVTWDAKKRRVHGPTGRQRRRFAAQPMEVRQDVGLVLSLPEGLETDESGLPVISGPVPVRMDLPDPGEAARMLAERFETAFFLDGTFQFEAESGYLPATWTFDPTGVADGKHYVTGNLVGYEGHFGIATIALIVKHPAKRAN